MAKLKLMKKEWMNWFRGTTLENITAWTEYYYINPDSQHWISNYQIWNEEWVNGHWSSETGIPFVNDSKIRNKYPIPCLPNTTYHQINGSGGLNLYFYDKNGQYLGISTFIESYGTVNNFTTPDGAYFFNFSTFGTSTTTYNNDICISLANPTFNGKYEPYIIKIEDILGVVDLGTLDWSIATGGFSAPLPDAVEGKGSSIDNIFCTKYEAITGNEQYYQTKTGICLGGNGIGSKGNVRVCDPAYDNVDTFKQSLNNVYLIYIKDSSPLGK